MAGIPIDPRIVELLQKAEEHPEDASIVSIEQSILAILFASELAWAELSIHSKHVGVHSCNRYGSGVAWARAELPLIISDHCDWPELLQTIEEVNPKEVWVTHGREDALMYQAERMGFKARALSLVGYDEEEQGGD